MAPSKVPNPRLELLRRKPGWDARRLADRSAALWRQALETPSLWVVLFLLLGTWALMPSGFFFASKATPGSIAAHDYVAGRDLLLPDEETTREKQERVRAAVLPVYDYEPGVIPEREAQIERLFERGRRLLAQAGREDAETRRAAGEALASDTPDAFRITREQAELLGRERFSTDLEDRLQGLLAEAFRRGVVGNKSLLLESRMRGISLRNLATGEEQRHLDLFDHLGYPDEAREFLDAEVRNWPGLSGSERRLLAELLLANLQPNLSVNRGETLARREAAAAAVGPIFNQVRKGQVVVRKGDQIDARAARILAGLRGERQARHRLPPLLGTLSLLALSAVVVGLGMKSERVADHGRGRLFGESLLLLLASLLGAKFCFLVAQGLANSFEAPPLNSLRSYAYATPFAALALLAALLLSRHAALLLALLFSLLASRFADPDGLWVIFYGLAGSLAAIYALDFYQFRHRLVVMRVGLVVGLVNMVTILVMAALAGGDQGLMQVGFDALCGLAGGLLVAAAASFAVPTLESLLAITTDIKLVELSNTNLPLLRRLAFEAPGTFQHSLMVANLCKEGCEAIGADAVLAYAGGLYHDVGKVFRPEYFIENQRPGQNRHDKLLPSMSALILINHVKEGLELAREHALPKPLRDAIEQHHGTRLIKYFYNRALEQGAPGGAEVREEKYRYPGPKPQNKVMGVLMLADGIEAASRTLTEPTPAKIRTLIRTIVDDCLRDGQLDETDLTLSDLRALADTFLRVLATIFHQRVDYPGFDFNADPRRERRPTLAGTARAS